MIISCKCCGGFIDFEEDTGEWTMLSCSCGNITQQQSQLKLDYKTKPYKNNNDYIKQILAKNLNDLDSIIELIESAYHKNYDDNNTLRLLKLGILNLRDKHKEKLKNRKGDVTLS